MKTIEIMYNPYKMKTHMLINGIDVCQHQSYAKIKEFIQNEIPLQTWIEPIEYLNWAGFVNETSDPEISEKVDVIFTGRRIDYNDLKRSIINQNEKRSEKTRIDYNIKLKKELNDDTLSKNIDEVVEKLKSDRFRDLVEVRTAKSLREKYDSLDDNYRIAKESEFYIVFAGAYSSGKSTLLNTLIRHNVLPTSNGTCTSKNCRIRHNDSLGNKVSLTCFGEDNSIVVETAIFDNDADCAAAFRACNDKPDVNMLELGANLSHLYPDNWQKDKNTKEKFTIVLIDTPGMDSAKSSENGINKHAELALDTISLDSKPMIVLCADANYYQNKSIGEFMREIISQSKEEHSGFNDRFLFLLNKSDKVKYSASETAADLKKAFAEYLTDSSKWNINSDEELAELAKDASNFVPHVFMTAAGVALAIQCEAYNYSEEDLKDKDKENLFDSYDDFRKLICIRKKNDFLLARYCDVPQYRKDELEWLYKKAFDEKDEVTQIQIQSGVTSVEMSIKDYIERYAYPIKVRGLLDTFEDILEDVKGFTGGILSDLEQKKKEMGENEGERKGAEKRKGDINKKIAVLEKEKTKIKNQEAALDNIKFDTTSLYKAYSEFYADIEDDKNIILVRKNKIFTGQKSHYEVENEINNLVSNIKSLFDRTVHSANKKLESIKNTYDSQLQSIYKILMDAVTELVKSDAFKQGEFDFTNSVYWKMNFEGINSTKFKSDVLKNIVDKTTHNEIVYNRKKADWSSSRNPFKKFAALFMEDFKTQTVNDDGYYMTTELKQKIDDYYGNLQKQIKQMDQDFSAIVNESKDKVKNMIDKLINELDTFYIDINNQNARMKELENDKTLLQAEISKMDATNRWLEQLKEDLGGM